MPRLEAIEGVRSAAVSGGAVERVTLSGTLLPDGTAVDRARWQAVVQLRPEDVVVELYYGPTMGSHELTAGAVARMRVASSNPDGTHTFVGGFYCSNVTNFCVITKYLSASG